MLPPSIRSTIGTWDRNARINPGIGDDALDPEENVRDRQMKEFPTTKGGLLIFRRNQQLATTRSSRYRLTARLLRPRRVAVWQID
jgi:hypothetical protein